MKFPPPEPPSEALLVSVGRAGNNRSIKAHCMATHLSSSSSRFLLRPATSEDVTKILEINHSFFQYSKTELPVAQKEGEKQETSEERIKQEDEALLEAQKQQAVARTRTQWLSENIAHLCEENKGFLLSKFAREEVEQMLSNTLVIEDRESSDCAGFIIAIKASLKQLLSSSEDLQKISWSDSDIYNYLMQPDSADSTSSPTSTLTTTTTVTGANEAVATTATTTTATATATSSTESKTMEYVMINEVVIAQNYIGKGAAREAYAQLFAQPSLARPLLGGGVDAPSTTPTPTPTATTTTETAATTTTTTSTPSTAAAPETTPTATSTNAANQQTAQQTNKSVLFWAFVVTKPFENTRSVKFHQANGFKKCAVFSSDRYADLDNYESWLFAKIHHPSLSHHHAH